MANGISNNGIIGYTSVRGINEKCITISGRGTIGHPIIRTYEFLPIVRLIVMFPLKIINIEFLCLYLSLITSTGNGTCIQQLTIPMLKEKNIILPPVEEQNKIVEKFNDFMTIIKLI